MRWALKWRVENKKTIREQNTEIELEENLESVREERWTESVEIGVARQYTVMIEDARSFLFPYL